MVEFLKKQWFIVLIACIFICFAVYITYDVNKGKLPGKTVDGKDVVVSMKDANITADDLYDALDTKYGNQILYTNVSSAIYDAAAELTDDEKAEAEVMKDNIITNAKSQYPTTYEDVLDKELKNYGMSFDHLQKYCEISMKASKLQAEYLEKDLAGYYESVYESTTPRSVSHILVKMTDASNPTDEEKEKVKKIEDALAAGTDFAQVAKDYSDDTSASNGGTIGYVDKNSSLVKPFLTEALKLNKGEVSSEWVVVDSSVGATYQGWHMIKVDETDKEALMNNEDYKDAIYQAIFKNDSTLVNKMLWEKAQELNITFADESIKERLLKYMEIEE